METLSNRVDQQHVVEPADVADLPAAIHAMKPIAYRNAYIFMGVHWLVAGRVGAALREFGRALRVGGNPLRTLMRIAWVLGPRTYLQRFALGQWTLRAAQWLRHRRLVRHDSHS